MEIDYAICYKASDLCGLLIPRAGLEKWLEGQTNIRGGVVA